MSRAEIERSVRDVVKTVLKIDVPPGKGLSRRDDARWDSLKHIELIFAVESALDVQFDAEEITVLDSVDALVAAAEARLRQAI